MRISIKIATLVLLVSLLTPTFAWAETSAGIKPSSLFYFLDIASEKVNLFFIFNSEKKANKALGYAEERLQEAKEEAGSNKPKAVEKAMKNYEANVSLATEKSKQVKDESKTESLLNTISANTSRHQEILKDVYEKAPEEAKEAISRAIEVSQKRHEEAERQIEELKQEVAELKSDIQELQKKLEEKTREQGQAQPDTQSPDKPLLKTTLTYTPAPATEQSLKESKEELEEKLKKLEKTPIPTPTPTPIKVEVVNQSPIPVQLTYPTPTPQIIYVTITPTPTATSIPTPTSTSIDSPTPTSTPTPTPIPTPVIPGTIVASLSSANPAGRAIFWGWGSDLNHFYTGNALSEFDISSTNEGFYIERIKIGPFDSSEKINASSNIKGVEIIYTDKSGTRKSGGQSLGSSGEINFNWSSINLFRDASEYYHSRKSYPYIPKNGSLKIFVGAQTRNKAEGATQNVQFSLDLLGLKAIGEDSGTIVDNVNPVVANNHVVYAVYPKFEQITLPPFPSLFGIPTVLKFSVTAMGHHTLKFDEPNFIKLEVYSSGQYDPTKKTSFIVYDENDVVVDTGELTEDANGSYIPLVIDFDSKIYEIPSGYTKTFRVELQNPRDKYQKAVSASRNPDFFQITQNKLRDDGVELVSWKSDNVKAYYIHGTLENLPLDGPIFKR